MRDTDSTYEIQQQDLRRIMRAYRNMLKEQRRQRASKRKQSK